MRTVRRAITHSLPWLTVAGLAITGLSCGGEPGDPTGPADPSAKPPVISPQDDLSGAVVTEPVLLEEPALLSGLVPVNLFSNSTDEMSFVSYAPGAQPDADSADVYNYSLDLSIGAPMTNGGLDPIAIPASIGDTLLITTFRRGVELSLTARTVPERKPPIIVRSDPPRGKTRVPLNSVIVIVFSEPVDGATVNLASVRLLRGTQAVPAAVELGGDGLIVTIIPESDLEPATAYTLVATPELSDVSGDALETQFTSEFTTTEEFDAGGRTNAIWEGTIAVLSNREGTGGGANGPWLIYLMDGSFKNLTDISSPSVETPYPYRIGPQQSPDGSQIAFWQFGDIWLMSVDGSGLINLTSHGNVASPPAWSPESDRIAYQVRTDVSYIEVLKVDGSAPATQVASGFEQPDWSPDGSRIVFASEAGIGVAHADGSRFEILVNATSARHPKWSPDGSRVAFTTMGTAVAVVNADGSEYELLVDIPGYSTRPLWSPDGSKIAFLRRLPSCWWPCVLAVIDSTGNSIFEMHDFKDTPEFHLIWPVVWSPDGSRLAFSVRWFPIDRLYMIDSDGTDLTQVTDGRAELESYIIGSWVP